MNNIIDTDASCWLNKLLHVQFDGLLQLFPTQESQFILSVKLLNGLKLGF